MKKIISMITCLIILTCMLVVPEPIEVHAEETENSKVYYIDFLQSTYGSGKIYDGYAGHMEFMVNGDIVMYCVSSANCISVNCIILNEDVTINNCYSSLINISNAVINRQNYKYIKANYTFKGGFDYDINDIYKQADGVIAGDLMWVTSTIEESGFLRTNIPIFKDEVTAKEYLQGNVSIEDALNFNSDLLQTITDSNEVPAPKNLRIEYDSKTSSFFLMWEYNPEDLEKLNLIAVTGIDKELEVRHLREDYLSWNVDFDVSLDEYLQPQLSYKIDITNDVARLRNAIVDSLSGSIEYRVKLDYWVMGSWNKSSTELHIGKVFHVELLLDSSDKGFVVNTNNYVTDKDMNVLDDLIYDNNLDFDSNFSSSDFLGNITSGFNLLGSNGLIPLLTSTLSFIPSPLWAIIGAGLSLMVIIALFKLIIK